MANIDDYSTDKNYIKLLYGCFYDLHNILVDFNVSYWSSAGTLLGAVRHKGIIPIDDDVDISISYKDIDIILSSDFKKALKKKGYFVKIHKEQTSFDWIKINSKKKVDGRISSIDIFPVYMEKDHTGKLRTHFESSFPEDLWPNDFLYLDELLPLKQVKFGSGVIFIPNKPKKHLDRLYGKSWKNTMYVTMDKDHMMLDKPIKIKSKNFKPARDYASSDRQILVSKNDIILTMKGSNLV